MTTPTPTPTHRYLAPPSVAAQIASLPTLPMAEIKALWVIACADGQYEFQGRTYPSLSRIAREITGTRWSGPLFFGLKASSASKAPAKKGARR